VATRASRIRDGAGAAGVQDGVGVLWLHSGPSGCLLKQRGGAAGVGCDGVEAPTLVPGVAAADAPRQRVPQQPQGPGLITLHVSCVGPDVRTSQEGPARIVLHLQRPPWQAAAVEVVLPPTGRDVDLLLNDLGLPVRQP